MTRRYNPAIHDLTLTELNQKWRRTDQEIGDAMGFDKSTIHDHRVRLGLPTNHRPRSPVPPKEESRPAPREKANPLAIAKTWLGKRLVEKPSGYWLDGCPANLIAIMKAANSLMKASGAEQLGPRAWHV